MGRVIVVGVDALVLPLVKRFAAEGHLPHFARMLRDGACSYALPVIPPYTPTNWATIASGALPGRHGAGNWTDVTAADPPDRTPLSTFDARTLGADTLWAAADRVGRRSLLITYPGSYPTSLSHVTVVAPLYRSGLAGHSFVRGGEYWLPVGEGASYAFPMAATARGRLLVPTADGHDEVDLAPLAEAAMFSVQRTGETLRVTWADQPLVDVSGRQWSPWAIIPWPAGRRASVRFKVLRWEPDRVQLLRSEIYPIDQFTHPLDYAPRVFEEVGPFFEHPATVRRDDDASLTAIFEEIRDQVDWYGGVVRHASVHRPWDLAMMHWHWVDTAQHGFLAGLDPEEGTAPDPRAESALRKSYQLADRLLGHMLDELQADDHLLVVSDHGCVPNRRVASIARRLVEVGLAEWNPDAAPRELLDPDRSRVLTFSPHELVVNLAGRNAHGTVPPADYEAVVRETVDALLDWKDDPDQRRVVAYALPKEHQHLLGYFGERCGDVMYLFNPGYSWGTPREPGVIGGPNGISNHGPQLPTTITAQSANLATLMAIGPRIRPGFERDYDARGYVSLTDVAPLVAELMGMAPPLDCRGAMPVDFLTDGER